MSRLTIEKTKRLYADGSVSRAANWLREQDDPFGTIVAMKLGGNLELLLAHYKEPDDEPAAPPETKEK